MATQVDKQLCSDCEDWTSEECEHCDLPTCASCYDDHRENCDSLEEV